MAKKVTTLFIRDDIINLLVVEGKQIKQWARLPLEPGLVRQGLVLDEEQVADKLKELFKLEKVSTDKVIIGLSGHNSLYRLLTLPDLPEAVVAEAVRHEARRVIPVPLDEVYLSYQLVPAPEKERHVFLAAFPRNLVDALIRTLKQAGIEPYIMDLSPLALCRTLFEPRGIIVNARFDHLNIMVMEDRLPQVIRRLTLPGEAKSLSEKLPTIIEELNRTVAFYNSSHQDKPIDSTMPVFVCGDLAETPESWQPLVSQLSYSFSALSSPLESPEGFNANEFMVNIGLALKELSPEKWGINLSLVNFNTLPDVYLSKPLRVSQILIPAGITVGIGLVIFLAFFTWNGMAHNKVLRSQLAPIESHISLERAEIATLQEQIGLIQAQIEPVEATTGILNTTLTSLGESREVFDGDLSEIDRLKPTTVDFTEVNHTGDTVTISGVAPDEKKIFKYARDLRSCDRNFTVIISSITAISEDEGFNFVFLLKHDG
jgi:type IV pilus assembly protein PilM